VDNVAEPEPGDEVAGDRRADRSVSVAVSRPEQVEVVAAREPVGVSSSYEAGTSDEEVTSGANVEIPGQIWPCLLQW